MPSALPNGSLKRVPSARTGKGSAEDRPARGEVARQRDVRSFVEGQPVSLVMTVPVPRLKPNWSMPALSTLLVS